MRSRTVGATRLAGWLSERDIPHSEFAARLKVARNTIWRWTAGYAVPSFGHMADIAKATNDAVRPSDWLPTKSEAHR